MAIDIIKPLKKLLPYLLKAQEENLSEADTLQRIVKVFEDVLGYDVLTEVTREKQIRDKYVDLAIKIDGSIKFLVEVKAAGIALKDRHIDQAERYAAEDNIRWVLLTNGVAWNLYHLEFEEGIEYEHVFTIDLVSDPIDKAANMLCLLHRQSILRGEHEEYWQRHVALSPESIARVLFTEETLRFLRRQLRKSEKILFDIENLGQSLHNMFSTEARERIGPLKIRKGKPKIKSVVQKAMEMPTCNEVTSTVEQGENLDKG